MAEAALELMIADLRSRQNGAAHKSGERVLSHAMIIRESSGPPPGQQKPRSRKKTS
jgi:LacI family transcriptional regulator